VYVSDSLKEQKWKNGGGFADRGNEMREGAEGLARVIGVN
jgi:hypothetical protein